MRKYSSVFLCFVLVVVLLLGTVAVQGAENDSRKIYYTENYIYEENEDGTVSILYYVGESQNVTVPAYIDYMPVVSVESQAFYGTRIQTAVVSEGIRSLGDEVFFNCNRLKLVSLPSTLESVGKGVFRVCENLESVNFGNNKGVLGMYMFYGCTSLKSVTLPEGVREIPKGAFSYCIGLTETTLPEGVETIEDYAFYRSGLVRVEFPLSMRNINTKAFAGSTALSEIVAENVELDYIASDAFDDCATTFPGSSEDPTEPSDSNTPVLPPPWAGDDQNPTEDPGVCTADELPTEEPTEAPTIAPTGAPTESPTMEPTYAPTCAPTVAPSDAYSDPAYPFEGDITEEGYCIGSYTDMSYYENNVSLNTKESVDKNKKELLEIAYNVRTAGDANKDGQVNIKDATAIQKYIAGLTTEADPDFSYKNSDVDTDGQVNIKDATKIQKFIAGLVSTL